MFPSSKIVLLSAASVVLASAGAATAADTVNNGNPYLAGDMHNHNTCQDGSVSAQYAIDRSVDKGTHIGGGTNYNLDWFTLGNHGGSGNRDCRFDDTSLSQIGTQQDPTKSPTGTWYLDQTLGQTIGGITINKIKGTVSTSIYHGPDGNHQNMWKWQQIQDLEYPILASRSQAYNKVLIEGEEWVVPGHEHTDMAVLTGQTPLGSSIGNADAVAEFDYLFDRGDTDAVGATDANGKQIWPAKNTKNSGTDGHLKAVQGVAWLQSRYPLTSYAIPTHSERAGAFNPTGNGGYNIEHFRDFNNAGPTVAIGIESPGHMAQGSKSGGSGSYSSSAVGGGTYGFEGVYTAKIGGLWDGLLGEGRNSFIFVSSDWHTRNALPANSEMTNSDFMPGQYTKLYVPNTPGGTGFKGQTVIDGMRSGNSYSVNADMIGPDMVFTAVGNDGVTHKMGETVVVTAGATVTLNMQLTVPATNYSPYSFNNPLLLQDGIRQPLNKPSLDHVDLITGVVTGPISPSDPAYSHDVNGLSNASGVAGASLVYNSSTVLAQQINVTNMNKVVNGDGSVRYSFTTTIKAPQSGALYVRARGTNIPVATPNVTDASGAPVLDVNNASVVCADPACPSHLDTNSSGQRLVTYDVQAWSNTWFYTNPIFVRTADVAPLLVEKNAALAKTLALRASR